MYGLLLLSVAIMTGNTALTKLFQRSVRFDLGSMAMYNLINACLPVCFSLLARDFKSKSTG